MKTRHAFTRVIVGISIITVLTNGFTLSSFAACPNYGDFSALSEQKSRREWHRAPVVCRWYCGKKRATDKVVDDATEALPISRGYYRVSTDTCGTSMIVVMIANLNTGNVHRVGCLDWFYYGEHPELPIGLRYRIDSQLLVAYGCLSSSQPCGAHFYKIKDDELHLVGCPRDIATKRESVYAHRSISTERIWRLSDRGGGNEGSYVSGRPRR